MTRRARMAFLILAALGFILRLREYFACPSYWYDEAYLLLNIFDKTYLDLLGPLREDQAAPPLFLWLLRGLYLAFGGSEWAMRLPALTASIVGFLSMGPLARRVVGRGGWLWAVAFAALGHRAIAHAIEVKPYAFDFLTSASILLAAIHCRAGIRSRWPWIVLCILAGLAPWLSYPAVFVVGAAIVSVLVRAFRRRPVASIGTETLLAFLAAGLFLFSTAALWHGVVRHQTTASLQVYWSSSFLDLSSPRAAASWIGYRLLEIGNYGTREMGLPLLILALIGGWTLRRRLDVLVLLIGPFLLALVASALRLYPLGGRLLFFLTPCLWLLAARGLGALVRRLPSRWARVGWIAPVVLLVPALGWAGRLLVQVTPRCQFREAFAFVEQNTQKGDVLWVSHPQVFEVYRGATPDLSAYSPPELVERTARTQRLWMVCAVAGSRERYTAAETVARVKDVAGRPLIHRRFRGLEVVLYAPASERVEGNR